MPIILFLGRGTTANVAIRCGAWGMVTGTRYRVVTDKIVEGRAHGRALSDGALDRSNSAVTSLWRRPPGGDWSLVEVLGSDAFGHMTSGSLPEIQTYVDDAPSRWTYGSGPDVDDVTVIGIAYTREYIALVERVGAKDLDHLRDSERRLQVYYISSSGEMTRRVYDAAGVAFTEAAIFPGETDGHPNIMQTTGQLTLIFKRGDDIYAAQSFDNGRNWRDPYVLIEDRDLPVAAMLHHRTVVCLMAHDGTNYRRSVLTWRKATKTWEKNSAAERIIVAADPQRGSIDVDPDGGLTFFYVDISGDVQYVQGKLDLLNARTWD